MLTYSSQQSPSLVSNSTQPVYTIAYRATNGGSILAPNILTKPSATSYVTAARGQITEVDLLNNDFDNEDKSFRTISRQHNSKEVLH